MSHKQRTWSLNPFSVTGAVGRAEYSAVGFTLMVAKYAGEAAVILATTGRVYTPLNFVAPWVSQRAEVLDDGPAWLGLAWVAWTIPFVWIAVAMTLRRARDAAITPWVCLLILVPLVNFGLMLFMAWAPAGWGGGEVTARSERERAEQELVRSAFSSPQADELPPAQRRSPQATQDSGGLIAALGGLGAGVGYSLALVVLSVYGFESYGAALFFGAPIVTGAVAAYLYNRRIKRGVWATMGHSMLLVVCSCSAFLLVGLEGVICVVMAIPIMGPLTLFGALVGYAIAAGAEPTQREGDDRGMLGCLLVLPLVAGIEGRVAEPMPLMVETAVEIGAPREEVWRVVVAFPEIETTPAWYFRWGIASPVRARIEGLGVGAVRYCEFTTGAFVEPITVWDEPRRLAFDVTDQPDPMYELTPYRHLHPPHLSGSFLSQRGEFELTETDSGGTRLVGRTWYTLDIAPHPYWRHWTDAIVHRIHRRVLEHIREVAERDGA